MYEDLVKRALGAQERARALTADAARVTQLARTLREARAGGELLLHCAWCEKLQVGDEWLRLDAIGNGQTRIAEHLVSFDARHLSRVLRAGPSRDRGQAHAASLIHIPLT